MSEPNFIGFADDQDLSFATCDKSLNTKRFSKFIVDMFFLNFLVMKKPLKFRSGNFEKIQRFRQ